MSRRRKEREPEPGLFDLPLDGPVTLDPEYEVDPEPRPRPEPAPRQSAPPAGRAGERRADTDTVLTLPLGEPIVPSPRLSARPSAAAASPAVDSAGTAAEPAAAPREVALSARYLAGLADLAVHLALAVILLFGARLLGVPAGLGDGPAVLLFLLIFSFLYTVIPLAFWGQTPGMAWAGLVARTPAGESLTFGQTALRWLGGILAVLLLSLPALPGIHGGRSLADRLSGSVTRPA